MSVYLTELQESSDHADPSTLGPVTSIHPAREEALLSPQGVASVDCACSHSVFTIALRSVQIRNQGFSASSLLALGEVGVHPRQELCLAGTCPVASESLRACAGCMVAGNRKSRCFFIPGRLTEPAQSGAERTQLIHSQKGLREEDELCFSVPSCKGLPVTRVPLSPCFFLLQPSIKGCLLGTPWPSVASCWDVCGASVIVFSASQPPKGVPCLSMATRGSPLLLRWPWGFKKTRWASSV